MNYKIVTSGKIKKVILGKISRNLHSSSEVFILSNKEIYLGPVSHKTLVFFATEFADYVLQNYAKKRLPEAEACINLTRKWIKDSNSVSIEELRVAATNSTNSVNSLAAAYAAHSVYSAANSVANYAYNSPAACFAADAAGVDKDKEFIRQGEFILDFLKCGKNLFLV